MRHGDSHFQAARDCGLAGFHSVRVNDQWRIVFGWTDDGAEDVDVTDYHG
jgi:plasmid maintenance system killer protein